ncbi:perforin-1-like isoform X2 [Stigmatopora argus]
MLALNVCAALALCLIHRARASCTRGGPAECLRAETVPGGTLAGEGFDVTRMERKGAFVLDMNAWRRKDKSCTLCVNPFAEKAKQRLPLSVVDWRAQQVCGSKVAGAIHRSSEALVDSSSSTVENNWKSSLGLDVDKFATKVMMAATQSKLAQYSLEKTKSDRFTFSSQELSCQFYSYRVTSKPKVHREFQRALRELPKTFSPRYKARYYRLIENFGTHYITKVKLGGSIRSVTSIKQCQASLQGFDVDEVNMCLESEASVTVGTAGTAESEVKRCRSDVAKSESKADYSSVFNDRFTETKGGLNTDPDLLFSARKDPSAYKEWLGTLAGHPDVISYSLESLHELLPTDAPQRKNLRSALRHYILERALMLNCSGRCRAGVRGDPREPCLCRCHNQRHVTADCCPARRGTARVTVTVQRASGLWGDTTTATDAFVKVIFGHREWRTPVVPNDNHPRWDTVVDLGTRDLSAGLPIRFQIWDQDSGWDDDLLGTCLWAPGAGVADDVCALRHGKFFYKWEVECAPGLGGARCVDYAPSPMEPALSGGYASRHAHPLPPAILLEMGVFPGTTSKGSLADAL